jgi:WD40 repeat protein
LALTQSLKLEKELNVHKGCVNSIVWNHNGDRILSGSDDQKLILTNPFTGEVYLKYITAHRSNIFSAKFLPQSNSKVISCAGNGSVLVGLSGLSILGVKIETRKAIKIRKFECDLSRVYRFGEEVCMHLMVDNQKKGQSSSSFFPSSI